MLRVEGGREEKGGTENICQKVILTKSIIISLLIFFLKRIWEDPLCFANFNGQSLTHENIDFVEKHCLGTGKISQVCNH